MIGTGTIIGELIGIEQGFERFGEWLKRKTGNSGDASFVNAFVTATLTLSIGAMAIVGGASGRSAGGLFHPGGEIRAGLYHRRCDDLVAG